MRENHDFVVPVNILTPFARTPFSWAARHTTMCLDSSSEFASGSFINQTGNKISFDGCSVECFLSDYNKIYCTVSLPF